jgi:hypothetical protein
MYACRYFIFVFAIILLPPYVQAQAPVHLWSGGFGDATTQLAKSIATDEDGNVFVVGHFAGTVDFGDHTAALISAGLNDIFIVKFAPDGTDLWSQRFGDRQNESATSVKVDPDGNVVVVGYFSGEINFGGSGLNTDNIADAFVAKFNGNGLHQWSASFGGPGDQRAEGVAVDSEGNVFVIGKFSGNLNFGGGDLGPVEEEDGFLAMFSPGPEFSLRHIWSAGLGGSGLQQARSVTVDRLGIVTVAGMFDEELQFYDETRLDSAGGWDMFVASFDSRRVGGMAPRWFQGFGDANDQVPYSVVTDPAGDLVIAGYFVGTLDLGGEIAPLVSNGTSFDVFLARFNSAGDPIWCRGFGGAENECCTSADLDPDGGILLTGYFDGSVNFGEPDDLLTSAGNRDIFVSRFHGDGSHDWSFGFGDTQGQVPHCLAADPDGNVVVSGYFYGSVDFSQEGNSLTSAGLNDIFVVKFRERFFQPNELEIDPSGAVSILAADSQDVAVSLYSRPGAGKSAPYTATLMECIDSTRYTCSVPAECLGDRGYEFYLLAEENGISWTYPGVEPEQSPLRVQVPLSNSAGPVLPDASYRIVGFPFDVFPADVADVFFDDLGGVDNTSWRLGRYDPTRPFGDSVAEGAEVGPIERGKGYWLIVRDRNTVGAGGLSAWPDTNYEGEEYAALVLSPGWNQIATPFAFDIAWGQCVRESDDIENFAYQYLGANLQYQYVSVLEPYAGYFVRNAGSVARTLLVPYTENVPGGKELSDPRVATAGNWRLGLSLTAGNMIDNTTVLGVTAGARDGYDPNDCSKPPHPPCEFLSLASTVEEEGDRPLRLAGDFRSPLSAGWRFELQVDGGLGQLASLRMNDYSLLPAGYVATLVDPLTGRAYELSPDRPFVLPREITAAGDRYELLVGDESWVLNEAGPAVDVPARVTFSPCYPNPFNPLTNLVFGLNRTSRVRLEIFDVRGHRVRRLLDEITAPGPHTVPWDGRNDRGAELPAGLYFGCMQAGEFSETRKMILIK